MQATFRKLVHSTMSSLKPSPTPPRAQLLSTATPELTASSLATASSILRAGGLVAFPTETVYGLGGSALSEEAVQSIYAAKGRPSDNPLIVHVSSREMMLDLLPGREASVPKLYEPLLEKFWPGALTFIFPLVGSVPAKRVVAPSVTAGQPSLALRMPSHPLTHALIAESNVPLAGPSANLSSRPSPTTAAHVVHDLGEGRGVGAILDGGECAVGLESTVVDFVPGKTEGEEGELRVLRAGGVSAEEIEACLAKAGFGAKAEEGDGTTTTTKKIKVYRRDFRSDEMEEKPTTPGMKYKHYAPSNARVVLVRPTPASTSADDATLSLFDIVSLSSSASTSTSPFRVGLMLTSETLSLLHPSSTTSTPSTGDRITFPTTTLFTTPPTTFLSYSLGSTTRPVEAAQRLFAGLRYFDALPRDEESEGSDGVDLILVECVEETGVGLAVMERARKSAGGAKEVLFRV